jgi:hypothetical protein
MRNTLLGNRDAWRRQVRPCRWAGAIAVGAFLLFGCSNDARAQEILRWKLKAGDVLNYKSEEQQKMSVKSNDGRERKQTRSHTISFSWTVRDVLSTGEAEITQKINRLSMRVEAPPFMPFVFDSSAPPQDVPEPFEAEVKLLKATVGAEFSFKMRPSGQIEDIKFLDQTIKKLRDALPPEAANQGDFSEQQLKDVLLQSSPPPFPEVALEPGKTWSGKPAKLAMPPLGTIVTEKVFTYQGPDSKNPKLLLIGMEARASLEATENSAAKIRSQGGKGSLAFDADAGRVVVTRSNQKMEVSISIMGQAIEQATESTSTMSLEP